MGNGIVFQNGMDLNSSHNETNYKNDPYITHGKQSTATVSSHELTEQEEAVLLNKKALGYVPGRQRRIRAVHLPKQPTHLKLELFSFTWTLGEVK